MPTTRPPLLTPEEQHAKDLEHLKISGWIEVVPGRWRHERYWQGRLTMGANYALLFQGWHDAAKDRSDSL